MSFATCRRIMPGFAACHTRSSIGVAELYADMSVEVEALFEVRD